MTLIEHNCASKVIAFFKKMFIYSTPSVSGHYNVIEISIAMDNIITILMQLAVLKYEVVKKNVQNINSI